MDTDPDRLARLLKAAVVMGGIAAIVLGLSGRWTDPWLWTYLAIWSALITYGSALDRRRPRARAVLAARTQGADRIYLRFIRLTAVAHLVLGALDVGRWHLFPVPARASRGRPGRHGELRSRWCSARWSPTASSPRSSASRTNAATAVVDRGPYARRSGILATPG